MATLETLRNQAARRLRDEGFTALVNDTDYTDAVNDAQNLLAEILKDFHKRETTSLSGGVQSYDLATDYIAMYDNKTVFYTDDQGRIHYVINAPYNFLQQYEDLLTNVGTPEYYWINGKTINFYPIPDYNGTDNLYYDYYNYPTTLVSLSDISDYPDRFNTVLSYFAASLICEWYEDYNQQEKMYSRGMLRLNTLFNSGDAIENDKNISTIGYFGS